MESKPLYKIGDKVEVIAREAEAPAYRFNFADEMLRYTGQIVTIANVGIPSCGPNTIPDDGYRYKIFEDGGEYFWASSMFRPLPLVDIMSLANNAANDTPTTIKIKVKTNQLKFNFKN